MIIWKYKRFEAYETHGMIAPLNLGVCELHTHGLQKAKRFWWMHHLLLEHLLLEKVAGVIRISSQGAH